MLTILVTGAAGFIGSHLSERLASLGNKVIGIDCMTDYYDPALKQKNKDKLESQGIGVLPIDLAVDDLKNAVDGVDLIYHLAAQPGISSHVPFADYLRNNINATYRLIEAAGQSKTLKLFVNISTSSVYGADATLPETAEVKPTSYYGVTKLSAEQLVLSYYRDRGLPVCSCRLFSVCGPRERPEKLYPKLIKSILDETEFPLFEGSDKHVRSYSYVGDIVDGLASVISHIDVCTGEIINLGTDVTHTTGEGIAIIEDLLGKKAKIKIKPPRPGDQLSTHAQIDKARNLIGYNPQTTLQEALAEEVAWYKENM